jgi:heat shock protein HslJ
MRVFIIRGIAAALILSTMGAACPATAGEVDLPSSLSGTAWLADDIAGRGVADGARSTMNFADIERMTGRVAGLAGCNRYFGPVSFDGDAIAFGNLAATRMMCPDAQMEQEQRFFEALSTARRLVLTDEGQVLLIYADGSEPILRFSRIPDK